MYDISDQIKQELHRGLMLILLIDNIIDPKLHRGLLFILLIKSV